MQLGGIGNEHSAESHYVTAHIHNHEQHRKKVGFSATGQKTVSVSSESENRQVTQMNLEGFVTKLLNSGRTFLRRLWGTNETSATIQTGDKTGTGQFAVESAKQMESMGAEHSTKVQLSGANPYFTVADNKASYPIPFYRRLKSKIKGVAGKLAGKLPGNFLKSRNRDFFQAKPDQRPRDDTRKHSRYKSDELEIDCILTDESYLMDSYDKKGAYRRLTTKK